MKRGLAFLVLALLTTPLSALAGNINTFQSGSYEEVAWLSGPLCAQYINLSLPAECQVLKATMDISSVLKDANDPDFPRNVQVFLNGTCIYSYNGTDYGAFGKQTRFIRDNLTEKKVFSQDGGRTWLANVRLPLEANVINASMDIACTGPWGRRMRKPHSCPVKRHDNSARSTQRQVGLDRQRSDGGDARRAWETNLASFSWG